MNPNEKFRTLEGHLRPLKKIAVAFSGGVDSSFLLAAAAEILGAQNVLACIGISPSLPARQLALARETADFLGVRLIEIALAELDDPNYQVNRADRCFHCKSHQFGAIRQRAAAEGFTQAACGNNFDDKEDFRPGARAVAALGILTPLADAGLSKEDIRTLSRERNLPTAQMPASPCLASRIAYGIEITEEKLRQVEQAEEFVRSLGFAEFRVRHHGLLARIEVLEGDIEKAAAESVRKQLADKLKALGFQYVALDLKGFRSGSLNEALSEREKDRPGEGV